MLEYDNSAFYYFALTLLAIYIIPGTWYALSEFVRAFLGSGDVGAKARTKAEAEKAQELKAKTTGWARLNTTTYKVNLVCVLVSWCLFLYLVSLVMQDSEVRAFDPYQILGIEQGVAVGEIKKQYRKLSLKFHPDKNPGNKVAEEMFLKIAKAYAALTDEASKENYEKYGNPDGKQSLEVSIGLPKFLLENPKIVLVLYLIGMVIVIPSVVGYWYSNSKQFGEKNILYNTYNAFYTLLQEQHRVANMPEIIAASAECRNINQPQPGDEAALNAVMDKLQKNKLMVKPKFTKPEILRGNVLLHAHMFRITDLLTPALKKDLNAVLARTPDLIDSLIEIAQQKKWIDVSLAVIRLSQCVVQAIWTNSDSFEQLPYFQDKEIKALKNHSKVKTLGKFLALDPAEREKAIKASLANAEECEEVLKAIQLMPQIQVDTKLFVEEDEEDFYADEKNNVVAVKTENGVEIKGDQIYEGDLVTLRVTLTRKNVSEGSTVAPVHAPHFPTTVFENWWFMLTDKPPAGAQGKRAEPTIHAFEKVSDRSRVVKHELRFLAPPHAGEYEMELNLISDCYAGVDKSVPFRFTVLPASELPEYAPHPEDVELDNEPTLFEQVMAANVDDDDSSDEEDEEDESEKATPVVKKNVPKNPKAVVEDVDSEDDE